MKVLYIGGTGEISTACVAESLRAGQDVTVFNRGRTDQPLPAGIRNIEGDMNDPAAYRPLGEGGFDVVCQFIAFDADTVRRDVEVFGGRCGQYVFISTASAYRKTPSGWLITEDVPLVNPYWSYSAAKAKAEDALMEAHRAGRIAATIVRPSHTYRSGYPGHLGKPEQLAWRMLNDRPILVHGDGSSLWTITHSVDFARPFVRLLGEPRALGEAFHITRHMEATTWNDIFQAIGRSLNVEPRLVHVPSETLCRYNPKWIGPLLGDKSWSTVFDNSKVMSVAGRFECTVSMEEGFAAIAERLLPSAGAIQPETDVHELMDRIAAEQDALGR